MGLEWAWLSREEERGAGHPGHTGGTHRAGGLCVLPKWHQVPRDLGQPRPPLSPASLHSGLCHRNILGNAALAIPKHIVQALFPSLELIFLFLQR